jgi:predicted AlkP superfamily phosphohydrolase/phosphomutase
VSKTTIIGIDGATFTVFDRFFEMGLMPNLAALAERGTTAPLLTVVPALTPPAWTSLMTGKRPGRHGVFDFFQKESADSEYFRLSTSQDIKTPTIWDLASEQDQKVLTLNFPVMFPAPKINGSVVPGGWMPWRQLRLGCHPKGLFDRLKELPSFDPKELSLDMELEAKAIEGCPVDEYAEWIQLHIRREERWMEIFKFLTSEEDYDLTAIMFDGFDKLSHLCWRFIDPASHPENPTEFDLQMIELCQSYFRRLDEMIGDILDVVGEESTVLVASDHGFGASWDVFYINSWLEQEGYLVWNDDPSSQDADGALQLGFGAMAKHVTEIDWTKTVAYAATPSSFGLYIVAKEPGSDEPFDPARRTQLTDEIMDKLRDLINPITGRPLLEAVYSRAEAFARPHEELGPDVNLVLAEGAAMSILRDSEIVRRRDPVQGNHLYHGVFMAAGPGVKAGQRLDEVGIIDIASIALYGLDVAIPDDLDGELPADLFTDEHLQARPPVTVAAKNPESNGHQPDDSDQEAMAMSAEEEATVMERLRALGYVE